MRIVSNDVQFNTQAGVGLPLHVVSQTTKTITLGWAPVPCVGYAFYKDGVRVSNTWDSGARQVKFSKGTSYRVVALGVAAQGQYP